MKVDSAFLERLRSFTARVRNADPSLHDLAYLRTPTDGEMQELRTSVVSLLGEAVSASRDLLDEFLPPLESTPLGDLASIIRGEVERDLHQIESRSVNESSTWQIGIGAVQHLSKILKAAAAIENSYCREVGVPAEITHVAETATAVEIRRVYVKFWRAIELEPPASPTQLEERLRTGATAIARLTGRSIFLDMRALDRRLLLGLQRRIREWLAGTRSTAEGRPIWQDLKAFAELIRLINNRQELVEHDMLLVPELMSWLAEESPHSTPLVDDPSFSGRCGQLVGRKRQLDRLLENPGEATSAQLLERLGKVEATMLSRVRQPQSVS